MKTSGKSRIKPSQISRPSPKSWIQNICTQHIWCVEYKPGGAGGGGGMSHWGLYIIHVNHFLKSTLNEDDATVSTAIWTLHCKCAPGYCSQISYPFRGSSADLYRDLWIWYPFFHIFLFSIPLTRYAPGGEKDTLFTRFYWRGWCTGPNETCPPPPPPPPGV